MREYQGDIFGNWKPIEQINLEKKCDLKDKRQDKDKSIRIAKLYGTFIKEKEIYGTRNKKIKNWNWKY